MPIVGDKCPFEINFSHELDADSRSVRSKQLLCGREGGVCTLQMRSISKGFKEGVPELEVTFAKW